MTALKRWSAPTSERDARIELAAAYRYAYDLGWTDLGATHFSSRVPDQPDAYLILQEGLFFNEVTASNLVKIGIDGAGPQDGVALPDDLGVNPAGVTIHGALLAGKPNINSIMHTHTVAGVAVCNSNLGLQPLSQHALRFYKDVGRHEYEGVALDGDEGPRLVENLADHELLLLNNHGLLTAGASVPQAFSAMYYAEVACKMQVATMHLPDMKVVKPSRKVCMHTKRQHDESHGYMYRDWMAIVRQVERTHPDFAD